MQNLLILSKMRGNSCSRLFATIKSLNIDVKPTDMLVTYFSNNRWVDTLALMRNKRQPC